MPNQPSEPSHRLSRIVLAHAPRQPAARLTCNVDRQKMKTWIARIFGKRVSDEEAAAIHQRQFAQHGLLVVCSKLCIGPKSLPVRHATRDEPKNVADSGWIVASGTEFEAYAQDPKNYAMVPLHMMVETDQTLKILYEQPVGSELTRKHANEPWRWIVGNKVIDQDGRVLAEL